MDTYSRLSAEHQATTSHAVLILSNTVHMNKECNLFLKILQITQPYKAHCKVFASIHIYCRLI